MIVSGTLQDVCSLITDGTHDSPKLQSSGVPFIKGKHISGGSIDFQNCDFITAEDHAACVRRVKPKRGDILFSNIGSVGDTAVVKSDQEFSIKNVALFRPDPQKAHPQYVYYLVCGSGFRAGILNQRSGAAQPFITLGNLRSFKFSYESDLPTQRKIAGILSAYDDLIENNLRRIKILEEMAQSLYHEWFVHFRFPGHESVHFTQSDIGRIPKGWKIKAMTEAVTVRPKVTIPKGSGIPFVTMGGLSESSMLITEVESRDSPTGARFRNGDILFARITPCLENGKTGFVEFLPSAESAACGSTEFIVLRSKTVCPQYVYLMARSDAFRDNAIKSMSGATGRQRVRDECFDQFYLAQPPQDLLVRFESIAAPQFDLIHSLNRRNQILRRTRNLLLPKLMKSN